MVAQTRWINGETDALTTGGNHTNEIQLQRAANVHNLKVEINIESEAMEANANGFWFVYAFPGDIIGTADLPGTWSAFDDEKTSQYIWGSGLWMASNQTPFHKEFMPKTTRNLPRGGRVFLQVHVEGTLPVLTNNRINSSIQFHVAQ